ncbi:vWA domain-containing protein [Niabella aurantiaca]|uniref:vWA domain-containing protein n=1 Tax=Niabella aurantiaca TaxID=379900 RepID=UPI00037A9319|nr:VWA domain-containing protein [Niabella aurantiaca]
MKLLKGMAVLLLGIAALGLTPRQRTIKGVVLDDGKAPVVHASVQVKGTQQAVSTDAQGAFSIRADNQDVLIITAVGFAQKQVTVGKASDLTIVLTPLGKQLDEVVVVGLGTQKKSAVVGSIMIRGASLYGSRRPVPERWRYNGNMNREGYEDYKENPFLKAEENPLSTFSIDVDGASYSNIRRLLNSEQLPPAGAVRIEEMINYFSYDYPQPKGNDPFGIHTVYTSCPWNTGHQLVAIGLQGKKIPMDDLPPSNLVFLIDVSGSMESQDKLPLVQSSMKLLVDQLRVKDNIAIVVYAGSAGLVLPPTGGDDKTKIKDAIDGLRAGGSTAGGAGISLAYKVASENFIKGGNNRVILCTDGDFNVGASSDAAMEKLIEEKRASGVYLSVLGYGTGNYQDAKMQKLANKGNGNHAYIDNLSEARRVLINQYGGTMFTIAKDVKLQVEFNPVRVQGYRLIGYENRMLAKEDFNDDQKDAGELGSGHTVTALYEIIPVGIKAPELKTVDALRYRKNTAGNTATFKNELMTIKFRYKKPDGKRSLLLQKSIEGNPVAFAGAGADIRLAAGLAQFGMLLKNSEYKGTGGYQLAEQLVSGPDKKGRDVYRKELLQLIRKASAMEKPVPEDISYKRTDRLPHRK